MFLFLLFSMCNCAANWCDKLCFLHLLSVMFHEAGVESAKVENVVRLGRRPTDPIQNPMPMKVVLDSVGSKISLLKKAKILRMNQEGEWSRIVIHQDLTPKTERSQKATGRRAEAKEGTGRAGSCDIQRQGGKEKRSTAQSDELTCFYINARNLISKLDHFEAWVL